MSAHKVTVVVPCYNGGRFFDQMFECLDRQIFRDFEVILVDDGSIDLDTKARLEDLPSGVKLIRQENAGLPAARNTGIRAATSEFILPLDCDDMIESGFLE